MSVVNKDGQKVPFVLKPAQRHYLDHAVRNNLLPKARQLGFTTVTLADNLLECWLMPNTNFLLLVQSDDDVAPTTDKLLLLHNEARSQVRLDDGMLTVKPDLKSPSQHRLVWANGSQALIRTANSMTVGRSLAFHRVHATEVAFWEDRDAERVISAVLGASGDIPRFRFTLESTGNGPQGLFYRLCQQAEASGGNWQLMFYNWLWEPGYAIEGEPLGELSPYEQRVVAELGATPQQLRWRRRELENFKILRKEDEINQEYPTWLRDCFQSKGKAVFTEAEKAMVRPRPPIEVSGDGGLRVWEKPIEGHAYVIVSDPSSGTAEDPSGAVVVDAMTMHHVATLEGWWEPHVFGGLLRDLGQRYNGAFQRVERNTGYGQAVGRQLVDILGYGNVEYGADGKFGIHTNETTKSEAVSAFKEALSSLDIPDPRVREEMDTYMYIGNKMGAKGRSSYDDVLMCLMNAVVVVNKYPHLRATGQRTIRLRGY